MTRPILTPTKHWLILTRTGTHYPTCHLFVSEVEIATLLLCLSPPILSLTVKIASLPD
ncbi:hypothetical protein Hanom_Chr02g00130341 [Helianthus anomalus]